MRALKFWALVGTCIAVAGALLVAWLRTTQTGLAVNPPGLARASTSAFPIQQLEVPDGFRIQVFARHLDRPRLLRWTPAGQLLVSLPHRGEVWRLSADANHDGRTDGQQAVVTGLRRPHGLDFHHDATGRLWLYIAETHQVGRLPWDAVEDRPAGPYRPVIDLPDGGMHWTRTLRSGPDGALYVSVGSSCNSCVEADPRRAALLRIDPATGTSEVYASGLRNAVGFDWTAEGALYATENGRDFLGDDRPPDELNRIVPGGFYGWPYLHGVDIPDPNLDKLGRTEPEHSRVPAHLFRAHNAPLGIDFIRGGGLPQPYPGAAVVALHGSWNRSQKDGYSVVVLRPDGHGGFDERPLVTGFERGGQVIGRPVDVQEGPDGALYISDDHAGQVYRLSHRLE